MINLQDVFYYESSNLAYERTTNKSSKELYFEVDLDSKNIIFFVKVTQSRGSTVTKYFLELELAVDYYNSVSLA